MDFGSAFTYPTRDPDWVKKALIGGVLWMIPIANFIQVGHLLAVAEEVSQGADQQLPRRAPTSNCHVGRILAGSSRRASAWSRSRSPSCCP